MNFLEDKLNFIEENKLLTISGLNEGEKAFLPYFFKGKTLIISTSKVYGEEYFNILKSLGKRVLFLKDKLPLLITLNEKNNGEFREYFSFLNKLANGDYDIIILSPEALFQKFPNKDFVFCHSLTIEKNKTYDIKNVVEKLTKMGYTRQDVVLERGDFSLRGDTLDIFEIKEENPIRISFFDDEVEDIYFIDKTSFKKIKDLKDIKIFCNSIIDKTDIDVEELKSKINEDLKKLKISDEAMVRLTSIVYSQFEYLKEGLGVSSIFFLPYLDYFNSSIFDYLDENTKIIFDEPKLIEDKLKIEEDNHTENFLKLSLSGEFLPKHMDFYFEKKDIFKTISKFSLISYARLVTQNKFFKSEKYLNFICPQVPSYVGHFIELVSNIKNLIKNDYTVVLSVTDSIATNKLTSFLKENKLNFTEIEDFESVKKGTVNILKKDILASIHFQMEKFLLVGAKNLTAHILTKEKREEKIKFEARVGEYVVHEVHGIGKCLGIKNLKLSNVYRDYIVVEYKDGDLLYVPSENANMLSSYSYEGEAKLNKLGGTDFYKTKQKVKNSIKEMASDMLKVYSDRLSLKGFRYSKDSYLQEAFENAFMYEYTEDQKRALKEIKEDMESDKIMDRLICGDVGFGKTEVALCAAFKAIQDGKQVAIICPTTILCEQHFSTATSRMHNFLVRIEALNRFKTKKEQEDILTRLKEGKIDLICGTHRLLSKDVNFKNLGLIIIDEEQRFGVEHKDKLKRIRKNVDVLSLSATPIPRTLYMSLVGIRDVSFITTPPKERKLIKTSVIDYSDGLLKSVCERELERNGQVLVIYNKVESIANFYSHLKTLLPNASISFAHGQMSSSMLERAIYDLYSRKTQILVSTVLIENGIDLPYANTLFVIDADKLGLSQLYQLKGRIGRSDIEAYAYFSFKKDKTLTVDSYKRLDALMEFSDFGSGYKLALRDLEIRGAGDVLGRTQHGHMQQVGYDMYVKLLNEAVIELRGGKIKENRETKIEIDLAAFVPKDYISKDENRICLYTQIGKLDSKKSLDDLITNLQNTYGTLPKSVMQLCTVGYIKNLSMKSFVKRIVLNDFEGKIYFYDDVKDEKLFEYLNTPQKEFVLTMDKMPIITLKREESVYKTQQNLIKFLENCCDMENK